MVSTLYLVRRPFISSLKMFSLRPLQLCFFKKVDHVHLAHVTFRGRIPCISRCYSSGGYTTDGSPTDSSDHDTPVNLENLT